MDYKDYAKQYRNWANSATSAETLSDALGEAADIIESQGAELDAAIKKLHGICSACTSYSMYHGRGKCATCRYDNINHGNPAHDNDNWEWGYKP